MTDDQDRQQRKTEYVGKRLYKLLVEMGNEIYEAKERGLTADELGVFSELDVTGLIAQAKMLGNVPDWASEKTPVAWSRGGKELVTTVYERR